MSTSLTSDLQIIASDIWQESATPEHQLGTRAVSSDGRSWRYAKAGGTALVAGHLQQAPAEITNHQSLAVATAASGATEITVTLGATAATANFYSGGYACANNAAGGYFLKIKSHPAADSSGTLVLTLEDALPKAATAGTTTFDLVPNPYSGVVDNPTTATSAPVGVAVHTITAEYYGWIGVAGPFAILSDASSTVGTNVSASNATAGAVEAAVTAQAAIGTALSGVATTEFGMFRLFLG